MTYWTCMRQSPPVRRSLRSLQQPLARASMSLMSSSYSSSSLIAPTDQQSQSNSSDTNGKSWYALFFSFFAMLQPDTMYQAMECHKESPFPSEIAHVKYASNSEPLYRYDMASYAANTENEDRSQYLTDRISQQGTDDQEIIFCGCYDGHGGREAVEFVEKHLYSTIKSFLVQNYSIPDAIKFGFQQKDQMFHQKSYQEFKNGKWATCSVGACAVIALIVDRKLYIASCGDCRAIMAYRDQGKLQVEQITRDHSANDARERQRLRLLYPEDQDIVRQLGRQSFYVKGRLQPTRSLGDTYMKVKDVNRAPMPRSLRIYGNFERPYISATPDIFEIDLDERQPEFLVLGSDGLFGELCNDEIVSLVSTLREQEVENVSLELRDTILQRIAVDYGFSLEEFTNIRPGERRYYHDDITIDVLHFIQPESWKQVPSKVHDQVHFAPAA